MPTTAQIDAFRRKARAQGFSEVQIEQSIAKKIQTEQKTSLNPAQRPASVTTPTQNTQTTSVAPTQPNYSLGGLIQNAGQDVLDFTFNNVKNTGQSLQTLTKEAGRTAILRGAESGANKLIQQQMDVLKKLKKEKDPVKKQQLLQQSREISAGLERGGQVLDKATTVSPQEQAKLEAIPTDTKKYLTDTGKEFIKGLGNTFGVTTDQNGNLAFDLNLAIQSAYEKPGTTALLAKDIAGGLRKLTKGAGKTVEATATTAETAKPGFLERTGAKMRKEVLNPQAESGVFYAEEQAALSKVQKELGLKGPAQVQLEQLPEIVRKADTVIQEKLKTAGKIDPNAVDNAYLTNLERQRFSVDNNPTFAKEVAREEAILERLKKSGNPIEFYNELKKVRKSINFDRIYNSSAPLTEKEIARYNTFLTLKDAIDTVSPEVRTLNTLQHKMDQISLGLIKKTKEAGKPVQILGTNVPIPGETIQGLQDATGRALEKTGQVGGKIGQKVSGAVGAIPQGLGTGMAVSGALNTQQPSNQSQQQTTPIEKQSQGGGNQGDNQQGSQIVPPSDTTVQQHPIFGNQTRQEVLLEAFRSGLNQKQINEVAGLYDQFAPQQTGVATEGQQKAASGLRGEYLQQTKQNGYLDVVNSYRKVINASATPAGDLSLIFAYMKMLDPNSTVREGEYASAEKTAGIPDRIVTQYNKILKGDKLSDKQREGFKSEAKTLFDQSSEVQKQIDSIYTDLASKYGVDPSLLGIGSIGIK